MKVKRGLKEKIIVAGVNAEMFGRIRQTYRDCPSGTPEEARSQIRSALKYSTLTQKQKDRRRGWYLCGGAFAVIAATTAIFATGVEHLENYLSYSGSPELAKFGKFAAGTGICYLVGEGSRRFLDRASRRGYLHALRSAELNRSLTRPNENPEFNQLSRREVEAAIERYLK